MGKGPRPRPPESPSCTRPPSPANQTLSCLRPTCLLLELLRLSLPQPGASTHNLHHISLLKSCPQLARTFQQSPQFFCGVSGLHSPRPTVLPSSSLRPVLYPVASLPPSGVELPLARGTMRGPCTQESGHPDPTALPSLTSGSGTLHVASQHACLPSVSDCLLGVLPEPGPARGQEPCGSN